MAYWRPIAMTDPCRPKGALPLAGGWCWFDRVERRERGGQGEMVPARELPAEMLERLTAQRRAIPGLSLDVPSVMGILNVTRDSFSDGGRFLDMDAALNHAARMRAEGAALLDVGGESTRPGADEVPVEEEVARTAPVIARLRQEAPGALISIDTRKAEVARAAVAAGAGLVNDVTGLAHDPGMAAAVGESGAALCLMHSRGTPQTMADLTDYADLLADVYDWLEAQLLLAEAAGIPRSRILVDPGVGFAKTGAQNLDLLRGLSLFHGLGCGLLIGVSRKRFIGTYGGEPVPERRMPGSVAAALAALAQGAQVIRVHDVGATVQAINVWQAVAIGARGA